MAPKSAAFLDCMGMLWRESSGESLMAMLSHEPAVPEGDGD
jgi:hypothetical protein